jgi:nucleotide-binding universal stress UspA family protein
MTDKINRLLCTIDGSRSADKAVSYVIGFAKAIDASVTFVTVNMVSSKDISEHYTNFNSLVADVADTQLHNVLRHASEEVEKAGLTESSDFVILHSRDIAKTIVKYAEKEGYDQIVCGSQGLTGITRLLIGSVAEQIVQLAHCPVTIIR